MGALDWLLLNVSVAGIVMSLFSLGCVIGHVRRHAPEAQSSFIIGYGLVFFFFGLPGWIGLASFLSHMGAAQLLTWSIAIVVNVVMQPVLIFGIVRGVLQAALSSVTRQAYAGWEAIPRDEHESERDYQSLRRYRIFQGIVGAAFFGVVSIGILSPWL